MPEAFKKANFNFPWWRGASIYQIYPRSFLDTNNDGIGDLRGIIEKLNYIASLGVDAVWISPFFTSPMKDFGYDVQDFCNIDPMFGNLSEFKQLLEKAHSLGLKIIIDQVYSHTSSEHIWFKESKSSLDNQKTDWYVWADPKPDGTPPNNWQSVFHGPAWEWNSQRNQYYFHNFLPEQPDLNLHNPSVQEAILEIAKFWLDLGVDGFRLDALNFAMHDTKLRDNPINSTISARTRPYDYQEQIYNMSRPEIPFFIEKLAKLINSYPNRFTVAELGGAFSNSEMKEFTKGDKRLNTAYGFKFLYSPELTKNLVINALKEWNNTGFDEWPSFAFSNHDAPRAISRWAKSGKTEEMARFCLGLLISLRGNIFIYQGEELALKQAQISFDDLVDPEAIKNWPKTLGRDGARTPMVWNSKNNCGFSDAKPWLPIDISHLNHDVESLEKYEKSILHFYRETLQLRQTSPALLWGDLIIDKDEGDLLEIVRSFEGQNINIIFNFGDENIELTANDKKTIYKINCENEKILPPLGVIFYENLAL